LSAPLRILLACLAAGLLLTQPRAPAAQELVVDLSDPLVAITTGFVGTRLVLFGSAEARGDIVVVVRGPLQDAVVRRKERVAGIWVNRTKVAFRSIPSFYTVAAKRSASPTWRCCPTIRTSTRPSSSASSAKPSSATSSAKASTRAKWET
jgi:uncharacterized protein (TIGR02186 family)